MIFNGYFFKSVFINNKKKESKSEKMEFYQVGIRIDFDSLFMGMWQLDDDKNQAYGHS